MTPQTPIRFGFVLLNGFSNMVLASAVEPLRVANYCAGKQLFDWSLITADSQPVKSSSGLIVLPDEALHSCEPMDFLFVICGYGARAHATPEFMAELRRVAKRTNIVGGLDAGAWILAEAGFLENKRATLHWLDLGAFREEFHNISVSDQRYVIDGNRITAGGATTVLELMLHLVRDKGGEALSFDVSNTFVYNSDRAGIGDRGARSISITARAPQLVKAIAAMRQSIEEPVSLAAVAASSNCSLRALHRLFTRELQLSPGRYYELIRLTHARSLAEETNLMAYQIAAATGYESSSSLSRAFKKQFGVTLMSIRKPRLSNAPILPAAD